MPQAERAWKGRREWHSNQGAIHAVHCDCINFDIDSAERATWFWSVAGKILGFGVPLPLVFRERSVVASDGGSAYACTAFQSI